MRAGPERSSALLSTYMIRLCMASGRGGRRAFALIHAMVGFAGVEADERGALVPVRDLASRDADHEVVRRPAFDLPRLVALVRFAAQRAAAGERDGERSARGVGGGDPLVGERQERRDALRIAGVDLVDGAGRVPELRLAELGVQLSS